MMLVESGRQAVWQHAKECGIADDLALIAKYFDIAEVNIFANGKLTYINDRLRKMHRVPASPTNKFYRGHLADEMKKFKGKK